MGDNQIRFESGVQSWHSRCTRLSEPLPELINTFVQVVGGPHSFVVQSGSVGVFGFPSDEKYERRKSGLRLCTQLPAE